MNTKFGKVENNTIKYAPDAVRIVTHHKDEWDDYEEFDDEGNGIGELKHYVNEYDTEKTAFPPTAEDYKNAKNGPWLPNEDTKPSPPEGMYVSRQYWNTDGEKNYKVYEYKAADVEARKFSKLKLYAVLVQMNLWDTVVEWMKSKTVNGMDVHTAFMLAQELTEDHPMFSQYFSLIKHDLNVSDEVGEQILEASKLEE